MTSKPDVQMLMELNDAYKPASRSILTDAESDLIQTTLEIQHRTETELQNIRDMTVMFYGQMADPTQKSVSEITAIMDKCSGICCAIDLEKAKRGLEI